MRNAGQQNPDHAAVLATVGRARRSRAQDVLHGGGDVPVIVNGTAQPGPGGLLTAPLSGQPCVWFRVLEVDWTGHAFAPTLRPQLASPRAFRSDMAYPDAAGKVGGGESAAPFAVADESGRVLVDPVRADVDAAVVTVDTLTPYTAFGEGRAVREWIVPPGSPVFACGAVRRDGDEGVLTATPDTCLVVSTLGEQLAVQRARIVAAAMPSIANNGRTLLVGLVVALVALLALLVVVLVVV